MKLRVSLNNLFPRKNMENGLETLVKRSYYKIAYKQTMWRVYRRTKKDEESTNYEEALNADTTEIRKSKSYEQKLACNIKNYSKRFYAYVRRKTKRTRQGWTTRRHCRKYNIISEFFNGI